jgi:hypothetical protein
MTESRMTNERFCDLIDQAGAGPSASVPPSRLKKVLERLGDDEILGSATYSRREASERILENGPTALPTTTLTGTVRRGNRRQSVSRMAARFG